MATFGELWTAILPAAVPVGTPTAAQLAREVGWVRVLKARVPAFDALEAGDVAIVPAGALAVVAPTPPEAEPLADALAAAGCAGILAVEGDDDASLGALCRAAVGLGLPVLRVARMDPNGLERGAIGYLVNRRAELEHRAGELEATLEEVALGSGDVDALIAAVAGFLGRAVALEGRPGEVLAIHAPDGAQGAAAAVGSYLAGSRAAAMRIALPAPSAGDDGGDAPAATGGADEDAEQPRGLRGSGGDAPESAGRRRRPRVGRRRPRVGRRRPRGRAAAPGVGRQSRARVRPRSTRAPRGAAADRARAPCCATGCTPACT